MTVLDHREERVRAHHRDQPGQRRVPGHPAQVAPPASGPAASRLDHRRRRIHRVDVVDARRELLALPGNATG